MIICPVCKVENHHLAVNCVSCGGYVQRRVDNLDLFNLLWRLFETPGKALHDVVIAVHKNYVLLVSAITGLWQLSMFFRLIGAGEYSPSILNILFAVYTIGFVFGIVSNLIFAGVTLGISSVFGQKARFRNVLALCAYAQVPVMYMSVFLVPLEAMVWGIYFFTKSPEASVLYPMPFYIVAGMTLACLSWSGFLYVLGLKKLLDAPWSKLMTIAVGSIGIMAVITSGLAFVIRHL